MPLSGGAGPRDITLDGGSTALRPPKGGLLRHRDFRLLWLGQSTSRLGSAVTVIVVPLMAVREWDVSTIMMGVLNASAWLPWLVLGLQAGAWVDRWDRRTVMIVSDLVSAALFLSVPVAAWWGVLSLGQLLVVSAAGGVASVFGMTAYQAILPTMVGKGDLIEANARLQTAWHAANIGGPFLGGLIMALLGGAVGLLADAASFLISAACLLAMRTRLPESPPSATRATTLWKEIGEGLRFIRADPYLRVIVAGAGLNNLLWNAVQAVAVIFLVREVGIGSDDVGLLLATSGAGGLVGALVAAGLGRRYGSSSTLVWSALITAPFGLLMPMAQSGVWLVAFAAGMFARAIGMGIGNVLMGSFAQSYCPVNMLGRIVASERFVIFGTIPLGALLGGFLGQIVSVRGALWISLVGGIAVTGVWLVGPMKNLRDLPTSAPVPQTRT